MLTHRFADFVEGSPHLMPNEVSVHAQEYGFGGSFFEDELFDTDDEDDDDIVPVMKPEWDGVMLETKTLITAFQKGDGRPALQGRPDWLLNGFFGGGISGTPEFQDNKPFCITTGKVNKVLSKNVH